jgi:hypothetical protein
MSAGALLDEARLAARLQRSDNGFAHIADG